MSRRDGFTSLEQISQHIKEADRHKFFCLACRRDLTSIVYCVPHDSRSHSVRCPRCQTLLEINSTHASALMLFNTIRHRKWSPSVESDFIVPEAPKLIKKKVIKKKAKKKWPSLMTG